MKDRYVIGTLWLLAWLLAIACSPVERELEQEQVPVSFSAVVAGDMPATKAVNMADETGLKGTGFGVFACYTGLHPYAASNPTSNFMYNQKVRWDNAAPGRWVYEPVKYWPSGEGEATGTGTGETPQYVSFFAYAPYSDGTSECIPAFNLFQEQTNPWLLYCLAADVADQVDLLYAEPLLDQTKPSINSKLEFSFKHALACVGDEVTITNASSVTLSLKEVVIDYTLTEKARLVLWNNGSANWQPVQSGTILTTRRVTLLSSSDPSLSLPHTFSGEGVFCIPVEATGYPQKATIKITYIISPGGVERTVTSELALKNLLSEGKSTNIDIHLTNN